MYRLFCDANDLKFIFGRTAFASSIIGVRSTTSAATFSHDGGFVFATASDPNPWHDSAIHGAIGNCRERMTKHDADRRRNHNADPALRRCTHTRGGHFRDSHFLDTAALANGRFAPASTFQIHHYANDRFAPEATACLRVPIFTVR
jgi:hypothetical protein